MIRKTVVHIFIYLGNNTNVSISITITFINTNTNITNIQKYISIINKKKTTMHYIGIAISS